MCGIGGIVVSNGSAVDEARLRRMGDVMASRGPDDEGLFIGPSVGLVHRRLSILDLSERGNCPMPNEDGSVQALLNGEIYNWRELRVELIGTGHHFRSTADSEVLSHGYEEWGDDLFARLRGMFALAIWDETRSRLLLARDRMGEKPLYFVQRPGAFCFASTLSALLAYDDGPLTIAAGAIACYLSHSFIPATHTVWQPARVFPHAHYGVVEPGAPLAFNRYWSFPRAIPHRQSARAAQATVEAVLDDSVRRCLDADVPVGVLLSGGVDSSVVAALAARHHHQLHSFSVGFDEAGWSELPFARKVAEYLGLEHHETLVGPNDVLEVLPRLVLHYGQPFGDPSAIPMYLVSRLARQQVKVCLSGDGGDESFGGYWRVQAALYAARYGALLPERARRTAVPLLARLLGPAGKRLAAMNILSMADFGASYTNTQSWHDTIGELAGPKLRAGLEHDRVACRMGAALGSGEATPIQRILFGDFQVQLPDAYLTKVDVASMAASLEVRAPMLDVSVVETAWRMPDGMKLHWGERKWLLKRVAARLVPPEVIYRRKMGFAMPLPLWFKGTVGDVLEALMKDSVAQRDGWIDSTRVLSQLGDHRLGKRDNSTRLWLILWLELWFRIVVAKELDARADLRRS